MVSVSKLAVVETFLHKVATVAPLAVDCWGRRDDKLSPHPRGTPLPVLPGHLPVPLVLATELQRHPLPPQPHADPPRLLLHLWPSVLMPLLPRRPQRFVGRLQLFAHPLVRRRRVSSRSSALSNLGHSACFRRSSQQQLYSSGTRSHTRSSIARSSSPTDHTCYSTTGACHCSN